MSEEKTITPIPEDQRSSSLRDSLRFFSELTAGFRKQNTELLRDQSTVFYFLSHPWLIDSNGDVEVEARLTKKRNDFSQLGFDGERVRNRLEEILNEDEHLKNCCANIAFLAYYLSTHFVDVISFMMESESFKDETYDNLYRIFVSSTYSQPFKKQAVSHIFNFDAEEERLDIDGISIVRLDPATISRLIGEPTFPAFIHPQGVGDYFIVTEEGGPSDDINTWLLREREKAIDLVRILQYFKDGVTHLDYTVPHFLPFWVNDIRKRGIFFIGDPHRTPYVEGKKHFRVTREEATQFRKWWEVSQLPAIAEVLNDQLNQVRQILLRAGDYYEQHHERKDAVGRLIALAIALEALFTPTEQGELTFRIAYSASFLVGENGDTRKSIFDFVKDMYRRRNKLFHGQYDVKEYYEGRFVSEEEIEKLASIIRESILRLFILYLKGNDNRDQIRKRLAESVLDQAVAKQLRDESDPARFLEEYSQRQN